MRPEGFPAQVAVEAREFQNWAKLVTVDGVPTCLPQDEGDLVEIANWAAGANWRLRPVGARHGWAPFTIDADSTDDVMLVSQEFMTGMAGFETEPVPAAWFLPGTSMLDATGLLAGIDNDGAGTAPGWGFNAYPGVPDVTVGGVCAIGAHGTGISLDPDKPDLYGTMSNWILGFRALVSDPDSAEPRYIVREFSRDDSEASAFLLHLGRSFLTAIKLRVVPNFYLRRTVRYPQFGELFSDDGKPPKLSLGRLEEKHGRVQELWFPFTSTPIVQYWTEEQERSEPQVDGPMSIRLSPDITSEESDRFAQTLAEHPEYTAAVDQASIDRIRELSPQGIDLHGTARDLLLYVQHDTLRVLSLAYAVLLPADEVQAAAHDLASRLDEMVRGYGERGRAPITNCLEMRVTGIDRAEEVGVAGAVPVTLSPARPLAGSNVDRVIWLDLVTMPGTPYANQFLAEFEEWLWERWPEPGTLRAEWSKAWAFTSEGPWTNEAVVEAIKRSYDDGFGTEAFRQAATVLARYDAAHLYSSPLLDRLFDVQ